MVFHPPSWVPNLPEVPDSITVGEFLNNETHRRRAFASSRHPYTCGITGRSHSASEAANRVELLARSISSRLRFDPEDGTEWDRVVCVFSLNTIDYIPLTHAVHRLNGIVTPASAAYSESELTQQLHSSGAKAVFTCGPLLETARKAASATGIPEDAIFLMEMPGSEQGRSKFPTVDDLVKEGKCLSPLSPLRWVKGQGMRQVAYLCYSSGTSGLPKAVMISHYNVIANILQSATYEQVARDELGVATQVMLGVLPLSHIYGLTIVALLSQYRGDQVIVLPRFDLKMFLSAVERFKIDRLYIVPPIVIQMMSRRDLCDKADFSSVKSLYSGAAPLGPELIQEFLNRYPHVKITQSYGMTEAAPLVVVTSELDFLMGSSGSLLPGYKAKIIDMDGNEVTEHESRGELYVQSPSVTMGYLNNEKANAETFVWHDDGRWLKTGDEVLIRKSALGHEHLFIVDRIKELIKVKGHQVAPAELEAHLLGHPLVSDCAVIPVHHDRSGEVPKAFIVKTVGPASDEQAAISINEHVRKAKARYKWLEGGIEFIEAIPKSPSGKILRRMLREMEKQRLQAKAPKL